LNARSLVPERYQNPTSGYLYAFVAGAQGNASSAVLGTDIFLRPDCERVALWKHGSGLDPAGLDYAIKTRKHYNVRRQQERTLKKDDRVAVLGHAIAVVEQVAGREVHVALGNRLGLRIGRKEIVVNEQNNRRECEATQPRGYQVCKLQSMPE
jgi:preprotein translocase subunit YajC